MTSGSPDLILLSRHSLAIRIRSRIFLPRMNAFSDFSGLFNCQLSNFPLNLSVRFQVCFSLVVAAKYCVACVIR
jgi:hypothetical protein